ncbi:hypothetical protein ACA910_009257 [Epithemia clementina (nom. ined.)]
MTTTTTSFTTNSFRPTTSLALSYDDYKDSDRAHLERNLDEAMNNDWRLFRAKLVAQENIQGRRPLNRAASTPSTAAASRTRTTIRPHLSTSTPIPPPTQQRGSSYQRNWHSSKRYSNEYEEDIIPVMPTPEAGYQRNWHSSQQQHQQYRHNYPDSVQPIQPNESRWNSFATPPEPPMDTNIFAGNLVGGAQFMPKTKLGRDRSNDNARSVGRSEIDKLAASEDPFVSEDELSLYLPETVIDKHRWAHEIPSIEPGAVLIAGEKLGGIFHQTVVLITEHSETEGTFGIVINRPMEGGLMKICSGPSAKVDLSQKMAFRDSPVTFGGPVDVHEYAVLHSFGEVAGARKLCHGVYLGGSRELMNQVRTGAMDPKTALFAKGHVAWVPEQLMREVHQGVWYLAAASPDFILRHAGGKVSSREDNNNSNQNFKDDLWTDILMCMGGYFEDIARRHGGTGDFRRARP